jgi:hypothetical protein
LVVVLNQKPAALIGLVAPLGMPIVIPSASCAAYVNSQAQSISQTNIGNAFAANILNDNTVCVESNVSITFRVSLFA